MKQDRQQAIEFLKGKTRSISDFPSKGIIFRDLTTIFQDPGTMKMVVDLMGDLIFENKEKEINSKKLVGIEARGFLLAGALAGRYGGGVVLVRKPDKLPFYKKRIEYELEYGKDILEIHTDAIEQGEKVIIVDDLLATGGTAKATCDLVETLGGIVEKLLFMVELPELSGREKLKDHRVEALYSFEGL